MPPTPASTPLPYHTVDVVVWGYSRSTFAQDQRAQLEAAVIQALGLSAADSATCAIEHCVRVAGVSMSSTTMSDIHKVVPQLSSVTVSILVKAHKTLLDATLDKRLKRPHFSKTLTRIMRHAGLHTQAPGMRNQRISRTLDQQKEIKQITNCYG